MLETGNIITGEKEREGEGVRGKRGERKRGRGGRGEVYYAKQTFEGPDARGVYTYTCTRLD